MHFEAPQSTQITQKRGLATSIACSRSRFNQNVWLKASACARQSNTCLVCSKVWRIANPTLSKHTEHSTLKSQYLKKDRLTRTSTKHAKRNAGDQGAPVAGTPIAHLASTHGEEVWRARPHTPVASKPAPGTSTNTHVRLASTACTSATSSTNAPSTYLVDVKIRPVGAAASANTEHARFNTEHFATQRMRNKYD